MTKDQAIRHVRHAKSAHIRWRSFVLAMIAGLPVEERQAPVHHKACTFGGWFYSEGFKAFGHWPIFQDVEYSHELLHAVYSLVFQACADKDRERAAQISQQLVGISESLLAALTLLEEEIFASQETDF